MVLVFVLGVMLWLFVARLFPCFFLFIIILFGGSYLALCLPPLGRVREGGGGGGAGRVEAVAFL